MKLKLSIFVVLSVFLTAGCGKNDKHETSQTKDNNKDNSSQVQTSANDKSVEINVSGMTCTGCENSIKGKVKKVDGVKEVNADHKSSIVKASYDPAKTNPDAIKEAITAAGYTVEGVK